MEGGVEAHAQNLYPRLAQLGCDVEVVVRSPYVAKDEPALLAGRPVPPGLGPQGAGPRGGRPQPARGAPGRRPRDPTSSTSTPSARPCGCRWPRLLGLKVVVTHHSLNYEHEKWGQGGPHAPALRRVRRHAVLARPHRHRPSHRRAHARAPRRGGAVHPQRRRAPPAGRRQRRHQALRPRARSLPALRRSPHAREAPARPRSRPSPRPGCTGGSWCWSAPTARTTATPPSVVEQAERTPGVVCTGFQTGEALRQLYAHAGGFVLPSGHEGLSIALLEAISFGLPVVVTDIPGNRAIGLTPSSYVPMGDVAALTERLREMAAQAHHPPRPRAAPGLRHEALRLGRGRGRHARHVSPGARSGDRRSASSPSGPRSPDRPTAVGMRRLADQRRSRPRRRSTLATRLASSGGLKA